jgi:hypothetical protein
MGVDRPQLADERLQKLIGLVAQRAAKYSKCRSRGRTGFSERRLQADTDVHNDTGACRSTIERRRHVPKGFTHDSLHKSPVNGTTRHALAHRDPEPRRTSVGRGTPGGGHGQPFCRRAHRRTATRRENRRELLRAPQALRTPEPPASGRPRVIGMHDIRRAWRRQAARRLRPLARRAAMTARPPRERMRTRKPCVRARFTLEG